MPFERPTGDAIPPGSVGPRQVPSNPATKSAVPPIQVRRWVRNGTHPNASLESKKQESLNHAGLFRTKDYFACIGPPVINPAGLVADTDHWRFAFRSGPLAHAMYVSCVMTQPLAAFAASNSHALLNLYSAADESVLVSSTRFNYGPSTSGSLASGWKNVRTFDQMIQISPNTDYYVLVRRMQGASILSICGFELASLTENFNGYLAQNIAAQQPILDVYREKQEALFEQLWEGTDPKVFNWTTCPGAYDIGRSPAVDRSWKQVTDTTGHNILDYNPVGAGTLGSTAVSASTPGWHPDMRYKNRRSQPNGVPCVMKAFGWWEKLTSTDPTGGVVELKDSTGAVVATCSGWTATPQWISSGTFYLPAVSAKYDVHFRTTAGTVFYLWAVSVYPVG